MTETTKFSVAPIDDAHVTILADGAQTDVTIPALVLEYQYQLENGWHLLFFTDNCPFEETLTVVLLDIKIRVLDSCRLFWAYTPGILEDIVQKAPFKIEFSFAAAKPFLLEIKTNGFFLYNPFHTFGWHRSFSIFDKKYLYITLQK